MRTWKIRHRTLMVGIVPTVIMYLIISGYFISYQFKAIDQQIQQRGELLAQELAASLGPALAKNQHDLIIRILEPVSKNSDVTEIEIVNAGGVPIINRSRPTQQQSATIKRHVFKAGIYRDDDPLRTVPDLSGNTAKPFVWPQGESNLKSRIPIGQVIVTLSEKSKLAQQAQLLVATGILGIIGIIIALILSLTHSQAITQPLTHIQRAIREANHFNFDIDVPEQAPLEINQLAKSTRQLLKNLGQKEQRDNDKIQSLQHLRQLSEEDSRVKDRFITTISHELRMPLLGHIGLFQLIKDSPLNDEQRELIYTAYDLSSQLLEITDDMHNHANIQAGQMSIQFSYFDPVLLVKRCTHAFAYEAKKRQLHLTNEFIGDIKNFEVLSDAKRIKQVLFNLISNAIKFTTEGNVVVSLNWSPENNQQMLLRFSVEDSGVGIPDEKINTIFQAFSQLDEVSNKHKKGTGLGLSISNQIIGLLDGDIEVASEAGIGTRFDLSLLVEYREGNDAESPSAERADFPQLNGHVLLVNPGGIHELILTKVLQRLNLKFDKVEVNKAKISSDTHRYQLLIINSVDHEISREEIDETIVFYKQQYGDNFPIIIFVDAKSDSEKRGQRSAAQAIYELPVPLDNKLLVSVIESHLEADTPF